MMTQCKNCQSPFEGIHCPNCGQKDINLERPMRDLIGEVLKETIDVDGRAYRTIRNLMMQPGLLTECFLDGRRRVYTPPLRLYLVISISFFLLMAWFASQGVLLDPGQSLETDSVMQAQFVSDKLPRLMFLLLPVFALLLKIVMLRRLYFDHLIFSIHLHSVAYIVMTFMLPLEQVANEQWLPMIVQILLLVYFFGYFVISLRRVYGAGWVVATAKSLLVLFGYMMIVSGVIEATSNFQILAD